MSEITDVLPGEVIFSQWGNEIRDRAVMRYADETARDASEPLPTPGELAFISGTVDLNTGVFQFFDGSEWVTGLDSRGGRILDDLTINEAGDFSNRGINIYRTASAVQYLGYVGSGAGTLRVYMQEEGDNATRAEVRTLATVGDTDFGATPRVEFRLAGEDPTLVVDGDDNYILGSWRVEGNVELGAQNQDQYRKLTFWRNLDYFLMENVDGGGMNFKSYNNLGNVVTWQWSTSVGPYRDAIEMDGIRGLVQGDRSYPDEVAEGTFGQYSRQCRNIIISHQNPSGGDLGDVWFKVVSFA